MASSPKPIRCRWKDWLPSRCPFRSHHHSGLGTSQDCTHLFPPHRHIVEKKGVEPMTPCVQSRCSSQLSYFPYWYFRAPDRNRTGTHICGEQDFKSCASTYFATRAFTITNIEIFFYISKFLFESGKQDSNLRPHGPKPCILPDCTKSRIVVPRGIEPRIVA